MSLWIWLRCLFVLVTSSVVRLASFRFCASCFPEVAAVVFGVLVILPPLNWSCSLPFVAFAWLHSVHNYRHLLLNPNMDKNPNSWIIRSPMETTSQSPQCYSARLILNSKGFYIVHAFCCLFDLSRTYLYATEKARNFRFNIGKSNQTKRRAETICVPVTTTRASNSWLQFSWTIVEVKATKVFFPVYRLGTALLF